MAAKTVVATAPLLVDAELAHEVYIGYCKDLGELERNEEGATMVREMLETSVTEHTLKLRHKGVGMNAAIAIAKQLKNKCVRRIDLYGNCCGDFGAAAIVNLSRTNANLAFVNVGANMLSPEGGYGLAKAIRDNPNLLGLELGNEKGASSSNTLDNTSCSSIAEALVSNRSLTYLGLSGNLDGPECTGALVALGNMIAANATLVSLNLAMNNCNDEGLKYIVEPGLNRNKSIRHLNLSTNNLSYEPALALGSILSQVWSHLSVLQIANNRIGARGAKGLADALKINRNLIVLDVGYNSIGDKGTGFFAEALKVNSTLTTLNLQSNDIEDNGWRILADALHQNRVLHKLVVSRNKMTLDGARDLAQALCVNNALGVLEMNSTRMVDEGAEALADALMANTGLTKLGLVDNFLTERSGRLINHAMGRNTTLLKLDLSGNQIEHVTACSIKSFALQNMFKYKNIEPTRLNDEINRLKLQEEKLIELMRVLDDHILKTEAAKLLADKSRREKESDKIETQFQMDQMQQDFEKECRQLEDLHTQMEAKLEEMKKQEETHKQQTQEMNMELDKESERAVEVEKSLQEVTEQLEERKASRPSRMQALTDEAEQLREGTKLKKAQCDQLREQFLQMKRQVEELEARQKVTADLQAKYNDAEHKT